MPNSFAARACVKPRSAISSLSRIASCTRSRRSSASGKPRSTSTSPLPASTVSVSIFFAFIPYLVVLLCRPQALMDQDDVLPGRAHTGRRLLLEAVQNIDGLLEAHRVDGPERIATVLLDQLENPRPLSPPRLGRRWGASVLDNAQGIPEIVHHLAGKGQQVLLR